MTKAIILAAGRGSRMNSLTDLLPKCRTILHGKELIQWQFDSLSSAGVEEIAVVRGYLAETFDYNVNYFENEKWSETNMVSSLLAADSWLQHYDCIVSYSDIVFSDDAVKRLIESLGDVAITFDPNWRELWTRRFEDPLIDAETFKLRNGFVAEIGGKASTIEEIEGQYMGLIKFTPEGWRQVASFLGSLPNEMIDSMDMTSLLQNLIQLGIKITASPIRDRWFEVDSESDLLLYEKEDLPLA
jgi:choline kinase